MRKSIFTALAALATMTALGYSASAVASETVSVSVSYDDLNLSSRAGATALQQRIEAAVDNVCGTRARDLKTAAILQKCRTDALAAAKASVPAETRVAAL